jgi:hypothetical protein
MYATTTSNLCNPYPVSASLFERDPTKIWTKWTVEKVGNKFTFKSAETGKYLARCRNCW